MSMTQEFIQIVMPDAKQLAALVIAGRGEGRTMAQYAEACGVSASTLSRIANGKITKPVSVDLLQKLAENAEDPERCSFEELIYANGMTDQKTHQSERLRQDMSRRIMDKRVRKTCVSITSGLLCRGLRLRQLSPKDIGEESNPFFPAYLNQYDLVYNVEDESGKELNWAFCVIPLELKKSQEEIQLPGYLQSIVEKYAMTFLQDSWLPRSMQLDKISFVFMDSYIQFAFTDLMKDIPVGHCITSLTISADDGKPMFEQSVGKSEMHDTVPLYFNEMPEIFDDDNPRADFSDVDIGRDESILSDPIQLEIERYEVPYHTDQDENEGGNE